jgi:A/G-specific adenine glycosylase
VLLRSGEVLLEKRPSGGIWGGLWAFPEKVRGTFAKQCRALGCRVTRHRQLELLEHGFTHFKLKIRPLLCQVSRFDARFANGSHKWWPVAEARNAAIPTPVRRLIERLAT